MENFIKSLKHRLYLTSAYFLFVLTTSIVGFMNFIAQNDESMRYLISINIGFSIGILIAMLYFCSQYFTCIHSEEKRKALYIKETDERACFINTKTGGFPLNFILFIGLLATLSFLYINLTIYATLLLSVIFITFTKLALYAYYSRIY